MEKTSGIRENRITGLVSLNMLTPDALNAVISLSCVILPKTASNASKKDTGNVIIIKSGIVRLASFNTADMLMPLFKTICVNKRMRFIVTLKVKIIRPKINGKIICLKIYLSMVDILAPISYHFKNALKLLTILFKNIKINTNCILIAVFILYQKL